MAAPPWRADSTSMENLMDITWNVTEQEADYLMKLLATRPYGEVVGLIQKLVDQANSKPEVHIVGE